MRMRLVMLMLFFGELVTRGGAELVLNINREESKFTFAAGVCFLPQGFF